MATTTTAKTDKVDIHIPKAVANDDPNLFVSVNGKNFILPKGKTSRVPAYVAEEIKRSFEAESIQDENAEKLLEKAKQPIEM
jgi:predicted aconitase with swiveling domain